MLPFLSFVVSFTFCFVFCFCSRLESLQKKRRKLQSDRNSGVELIKLLDSLMSPETDTNPSAGLHDGHYMLTRNSCAPALSFTSVQLPAASELRSYETVRQLDGVIPLPVQHLNLQIMDLADTSLDTATVSQYGSDIMLLSQRGLDTAPVSRCGSGTMPLSQHGSDTATVTQCRSGTVPVSQCGSDTVTVSQCGVTAVPNCCTSSFTTTTTHESIIAVVPATRSVPAHWQQIPESVVADHLSYIKQCKYHVSVPTSMKTGVSFKSQYVMKIPDHQLPGVSGSSQKSPAVHYGRQSAAVTPANGLVISVATGSPDVETLATQMQRFVPQTVSAAKKPIIVTPRTSANASNVEPHCRTTSVHIRGQLVHLRIPTTDAKVRRQQAVSCSPDAVSSLSNVPVCSDTGHTGGRTTTVVSQPSVPCTVMADMDTSLLTDSVVHSAPCPVTAAIDPSVITDSIVPSLLQHSSISLQQLQSSSVHQRTPVSCSLVTTSEPITQSTSSYSVCCQSSVAAATPLSCSTPPASLDDHTCHETGASELSYPVIPNLPTPDPSCSSQE